MQIFRNCNSLPIQLLLSVKEDEENENLCKCFIIFCFQLKSIEEGYEKEVLSQLKRQASAHSEHLAEQLASQATTLNSKHQGDLQARLDEQKNLYYQELEKKVKSISAVQAKVID